MRRRINTILSLLILASLAAGAQNIRYVSKAGAYSNDGKSWSTAKNNIQDAIDDLADNGGGEVWVAAGTYTPTSSTEATGGSSLYSAFKIPAGISVYGGFAGTETSKDDRTSDSVGNGDKLYANETILSGDLSQEAKFTWNTTKKQYDTSFYGNCYHVVWFATNGFDNNARANAIDGKALLEGCTIKDGNAKNTSLTDRYHNAYGGGIYMVEGARVENCIILNCEASRDGGGVYMDGGGELVHCYIFECQALGIGVENGYGGGACMESNTSATAYGVERCYISGCVGRLGGGLAIKVPTRSYGGTDLTMKAYASAVAVVNNVATVEGGGVYTYQGGVMTQMTIANNQCNGSGVISNGIVTGRSAGLYCRDKATVLNSVMWGGECDANNDIQFATSRSEVNDSYRTTMKYCQMANTSYVDWSGTARTKVTSLSNYNTSSATNAVTSSTDAYPQFENPTASAGYIDGLKDNAKTGAIDWRPSSNSSLCNAGIMAIDLDKDGEYPFTVASHDIHGDEYTPHATIGAYVRETATITPYTNGDGNLEFFIDPNDGSTSSSDIQGNSWDTPASHLSSVFETIRSRYPDKTGIIVHVKEGTLSNTNPYQTGRVRTLTISVPSNVTVYGGYPSTLTGTSTDTRNPILYPSIISGDIMDDYDTNVAHLVTFDGVTGIIFDGLQVRYANASTTYLANDDTNGAGMLFLNGAQVTVKNCLIADCTADQGAAIYASGSSVVSFENCIIHNNASSTVEGIVYTGDAAALTFDHCDFLRNVGYACYLGGTGAQEYTNSVFYSNMSEALDDTSGQDSYALASFAGNTDYVSGSYCMFDAASQGFSSTFGTDLGTYQYALSYVLNGDGYPRFINPTVNAGVSTAGDVTRYGRSVSFEPHNNNPMVNAASFSGDHDTWGKDMSTVTTRDYGGLPDIGAVENHEASASEEGENAYASGQVAYGSAIYVRDYNTYSYSGASMTATATDESTTHSDGTTARDGSSWTNAINGNALYTENEASEFTSVGGVAAARSTSYKYKLGFTDSSTTYYIYYTGSAFALTTNVDEADEFAMIATGSTSVYRVYDVTAYSTYNSIDRYLARSGSSGSYTVTASSNNGTTWYIPSSGTNTYTISASSDSDSDYLQCNDGNLQIGTSSATWGYYAKVRGLQYAVNLANSQFQDDGEGHYVYVGGGVYGGTTDTEYADNDDVTDGAYSMNLIIKEGANLCGGFPRTGNPGEHERDISNDDYDDDGNPNYCRTFIDANSSGRVVTQEEAFSDTTTVEGFIIQNGYTTGTEYGGGVYLMGGGVIKNCLIQNNQFRANSSSGSRCGGGGIYIASGGLVKNSTIKGNYTYANGRTIYTGGAGVFSDGGTLQNSLIVANQSNSTNYYILGAALYISSRSYLYNCTIAYNVGSGNTSYAATGGVWDNAAVHVSGNTYTDYSLFYNCIFWGNYATGKTVENYNQIGMSGYSSGGGQTDGALTDCYSSIGWEAITTDGTDTNNVYMVWSAAQGASNYDEFLSTCKANEPFLRDGNGDTDYSLSGTGTSLYCINMGGSEDVLETLDITEDIAGAERVQDCTVDKGAYEYNGSSSISPDTSTDGQAIFYVTPEGEGTASGANPANAACASKLQKILDAAGRYKYLNPSTQVIVKVAAYAKDANGERVDFQYYANRTTDGNSSVPRVWSIMVPRGVEVWGGYTDAYTSTSADDNGFYTKTTDSDGNTTVTDNRDVMGNPTYFDSSYYSTEEKTNVNTYHVVTFTDKVFDISGNPYLSTDAPTGDTWGDSSYEGETSGFLSLSTDGGVTDRAVVDGIFITSGQADATSTSTASTLNVNSYGGGAIVTDYAHVRNCILRSNKGTYGGALALTNGALVSGCLLDQNSADYGGAIYVFPDGSALSDGSTVSTTKGDASTYDANMPHVYTSTIVNNSADVQGGGVCYSDDDANVRFNSTVIWQNSCSSMANISGLYSLSRTEATDASTVEYYPFNYCAVQDITIMGLNNVALGTLNADGTRFHKEGDTDANTLAEEADATDFTRYSDFGYYGLTNYSVLANGGMPLTSYASLVSSASLAENDFADVARDIVGTGTRSYVDIGARAFAKSFPTGLMLRIFVAKPTDVDTDAMQAMYSSGDDYYSMEGSSFAYPMNHLQDALDYIVSLRKVDSTGSLGYENANNLPFEIIMGRGTYYPTQDLSGMNTSTVANTFLIPEGVTIIGGFDAKTAYTYGGTETGDNVFYGAGYSVKDAIGTEGLIANNVSALAETDATKTITVNGVDYTILQYPTDSLTKYREHTDINANSIIEPWEFTNQTILSGQLSNTDAERSDHVVTLIANQDYVGALPYARYDLSTSYADSGDANYGYTAHEMGQPVVLDGLTISGGYAYSYHENTVNDVHKLKYNQGGGLLVDGNRYYDSYNNNGSGSTDDYMHLGKSSAVGYRDLHVVINKCKFNDNLAGFGGAVSTNGTLDIFNSTFEDNEALSGSDSSVDYGGVTYEVSYPGAGGAIYAMSQLSAANTIFANNEALNTSYSTSQQGFNLLNLQIGGTNATTYMLGGVGGAVFVGSGGYFHFTNCDFVRNQANAFPAVYTMNPNTSDRTLAMSKYNQMINTIVWGNDVNSTMESKYTDEQSFAAHLICNYGLSSRTGSYTSTLASGVPTSQETLDASYEETAWFSAYESGAGISTLNSVDLRDMEFNSSSHIVSQITDAASSGYQNCNITLSSTNTDTSGPNFVNPSSTPGVEGYLESSDWAPSRINNLTDNGSGKINQTVKATADGSYTATFDTDSDGKYSVTGIYPMLKYTDDAPYYNSYTPLGDDEYMYASYTDDDGNQVSLYRISYDPNPTHNATYVDIGVYEYPHTPLTISTDGEVDILWVSSKEKADNGMPEGSCWSQPTSDLQRAIETLLASRNGHRKEIRLMDGTYSPIYTIDGSLSFYIDTYKLNDAVVLNDDGTTGLGVQSLTIRGGYSYDTEGVYDVDDYQAIFQQQDRTEATSTRWNHLFYIHDATQRYGYSTSDYDSSNLYGLTTEDVNSDNITSVSIEIDGVTLINDQALEGTQGTAIYYEDVNLDSSGIQNSDSTAVYSVSGTSPVNIKVPNSNSTSGDSVWVKVNPAKIILSKCKIIGSGTHYDGLDSYGYSSSAVYLGSGGSSPALLFNNVMHSNYGDPLVANCLTYSTNNGYALNYGLVDLNVEKSTVHNSIFWRNYGKDSSGNKCDPLSTTSYGDQLHLALSSTSSDLDMTPANASNTDGIGKNGTYFSYNAYTGGDTNSRDYESTTGTVAGYNYNVGLSDTNDDTMAGPNFTDPEDTEILDRDFTLLPSLRLLNRGNDSRYVELTSSSSTATSSSYAESLSLTADNVYDLAAESTSSVDAAHNARFVSTIDVGPYENQNQLQRIYYINPNSNINGTGDSWESAYGHGTLDEATRLAYLYNVANNKEAYVFVKGYTSNTSGHLDETIVMRNGVSVYGGINPLYTKDCEANTASAADEVKTYEESSILAYLEQLNNSMYPYVGPQSYKTRINGIKVDSNSSFNNSTTDESDESIPITSVVDGFYVTPYDNTAISEPAIDVNPTGATEGDGVAKVALRHLVVTGFEAQEDVNIAEVGNSLIYEALFYDNTVSGDGSVLKLGTDGYAVNLTVEGKTTDANNASDTTPLNGSGSSNIFNSLVNYADDDATAHTLSGYNYELSDADLNYQLAEQSCHIDASDIVASEGTLYNDSTFLPDNLQTFVSYSTDRDLLGNRRLLKSVSNSNNVDYGAYETWRVGQSVVNSKSEGHYYPHAGSVVYIMKDNNLVMEEYQADETSGEMTQGYTLTPGFLLVQEGAGLYGQGNEVNVAYAAFERTVRNDGSIVSVPYAMDYAADAAMPTYATNGVLTLESATNSYYTYNGAGRSSWDYVFQTSNSDMWESSSDEPDANEGVLFIPTEKDTDDGATETYYRFTAQGTSMTDYIYTESVGEQYKTVELDQYDDRSSTSGGADFTSSEDMGWNCIGLPYLVSQYKTYDHDYVDSDDLYNMQVPHTMWLYYDGTYDTNSEEVDGDGGYYSVSSWDITDNWNLPAGTTPYVWVGEGIFVQTAAEADAEDLLFYRPVYTDDSGTSDSKAMTKSTARYYTGTKIEKEIEEVVADFRIYANGHVITVIGLEGGERVIIYDSAGRMISSETSQGETYSTNVASRGVYIVGVNSATKKVLIR